MKICFITPEFYPDSGGVANVTLNLALALIKRKHKVIVITKNKSSEKSYENYKGIKIYRLKSYSKNKLASHIKFILKAIFTIRKLDIDVVWGQTVIPSGIISAIGGILYKKISVTQAMGIDINKGFKNRILHSLCLFSLRHNQHVLALSSFHKNLILKHINRKVHILPGGYSMVRIKENKSSLKRKLGLDFDKTFNIIFAGRLIKRKGAAILIKAVKDIPQIKVYVIGDGIEKNNLEKLINKYNLENKVFLKGYLPPYKYLEYMKACDAFVFPTKHEAFGLVFLEAVALRTPVISTNIPDAGGSVDIFKHKENALLVDRSVSAIKQAIINLQNDASLRKKLTKNAMKLVEKYNWDDIARKAEWVINK